TCGLREDGTGMCWGWFTISLEGPYTAISAGRAGICALEADGAPVCWGSRNAVPPDGISLSAINVGDTHACGLRKNGEAVCWGDNSRGKATPPAGRFAQSSASSQ
ncbi:MAG: RTX toxin, partial [Dehalococcoidia bacterium]|nr:RTX toxin [Dehalococcoidia bacterium]